MRPRDKRNANFDDAVVFAICSAAHLSERVIGGLGVLSKPAHC
jgi:hypothetical protein